MASGEDIGLIVFLSVFVGIFVCAGTYYLCIRCLYHDISWRRSGNNRAYQEVPADAKRVIGVSVCREREPDSV